MKRRQEGLDEQIVGEARLRRGGVKIKGGLGRGVLQKEKFSKKVLIRENLSNLMMLEIYKISGRWVWYDLR